MFDYYGSDSNEKKSMSFKKKKNIYIYIESQRSLEKIPYEKLIFFLHSNIHAKRLYISARASVNYIVYARYMEWLVDGRDFIIHKATHRATSWTIPSCFDSEQKSERLFEQICK